MTQEEQYAAQWRKDAWNEGHRKRIPTTHKVTGSIRRPDAIVAIMQSIRKGIYTAPKIAHDTGFSQQFTKDRLRYMLQNGMVTKDGNTWGDVE